MKLNLEWLKKHPAAAGGAILVGLLVIFLLFRRTGSGGGNLASLAAGQQSGQLQLAELGAQESAQQQQLQTQLSAQEYSISAQEQQSQDQLVASIFPSVLQEKLYQTELTNQSAEQSALIPLEERLVTYGTSGKAHGSLIGLSQNELAILEAAGTGGVPQVGTPYEPQGSPSGFNLSLPGFSIGTQLGTGLFG